MYENEEAGGRVFAFDELSNLMLEQGVECSPSQLHGTLCGFLCAGLAGQPEEALSAVATVLDADLFGELAGQTMELYSVTAAALLDEEFDFHPLLPDDEVDIEERTVALADWCQGFHVGYAQQASGGAGEGALSADSQEILADFAAITEAEADDPGPEDEAEESFMELTEYIRFATLNLFMDMISRGESDGSREPRDTIH